MIGVQNKENLPETDITGALTGNMIGMSGDYLIYTDAGSVYVNRIQYLIDCMEREGQELMVFSLQKEMLERKYTKRDAFVLMGCDTAVYGHAAVDWRPM